MGLRPLGIRCPESVVGGLLLLVQSNKISLLGFEVARPVRPLRDWQESAVRGRILR